MAIEVGNIPAFDQSTITGIGLAVPFKNNPTQLTSLIEYPDFLASPVHNGDPVFTINYTTSEQIKYNLINYFLTRPGERVFNPNFGSKINNFLFEQNNPNTAEIIKKLIEDDIKTLFPVIKLKEVIVNTNFDNYSIVAQVFYSVFSSLDESVEFNIPL